MFSLADAVDYLRAAGIPTPEADARLIAADLAGVDLLTAARSPLPDGFWPAIERRARREPVQHITGHAAFGPLDLQVGPGVFIPRPETEVLADWAVRVLGSVVKPRVVDLCTGSGALALYIKSQRPQAEVAAVELSPAALDFAQRNAARLGLDIEFVAGDATDPALLPDWWGSCDLVVSNPPYVPEDGGLDPEVYADPHDAVFAGEDGMAVIDKLIAPIFGLLRPGGRVGIEHDDTTSALVRQGFAAHGGFGAIEVFTDLTGRERFVSASKLGR